MNTDFELYRTFYEVVKYKNISRTAENMYISQSAVTQSIQKLESILGGKVFYRNKTGVELTEEGKNLYEYIKNSVETMSNAENIFSKYINLQKGSISIGGGNSLFASLLLEPFLIFIKKYPNINASIVSGMTDNLVQSLSNGELDIVILNSQDKAKKYSNVETIPLRKSSFSFFASKKYIKSHPIETLSDIQKYTLITPKSPSSKRMILDNFCKENNLSLSPNYEVSSSSVTKKLVLNDIGIGFTSTENLKDIKNNIQIIHKIELDSMQESIATLKKNMCNKATIEFIKDIKSYYNK